MADSYKKLAQGYVSSSAAAIYTVPGATQAIVKHIRIINTDTANRWVKLWDGGTADTNLIIPQTYVAAGGYIEIDGPICMAATIVLNGQAEVASKLVITVYGVEIT